MSLALQFLFCILCYRQLLPPDGKDDHRSAVVIDDLMSFMRFKINKIILLNLHFSMISDEDKPCHCKYKNVRPHLSKNAGMSRHHTALNMFKLIIFDLLFSQTSLDNAFALPDGRISGTQRSQVPRQGLEISTDIKTGKRKAFAKIG